MECNQVEVVWSEVHLKGEKRPLLLCNIIYRPTYLLMKPFQL